MLTINRDPENSVTLRHGDPLNLTCTIELDPAVDIDVEVTGVLSGQGIQNPNIVTVNSKSLRVYQITKTITSLKAGRSTVYTCNATIIPGPGVGNVVASQKSCTVLHITVGM